MNAPDKFTRSASRDFWIQGASFGFVVVLCALGLVAGLLPGLLAVCASFLVARALQSMPLGRGRTLPSWAAATIVIMAPVVGLVLGLMNVKGYTILAVNQYQQLLQHLAATVLQLRDKLPGDLAKHLPAGAVGVQELIANYLLAQASSLAMTGRAWLHGLLLAYVGLIIGSLLGVRPVVTHRKPLAQAVAQRTVFFVEAFRQIVAAQFWIAAVNAVLTGLFLWVLLPVFDVEIPYSYALVGLTFTFGLIPIVGNLIVNVVMTIAGASVSPMVGVACLAFLVVIHKLEYFINAKVVGSKTSTGVWELLAVMFVFETLFGVAGLVAAPLYYAYVKKELAAAGLV